MSLYRSGEYTITELTDLFGIGRSTIYRALRRARTRNATGMPAGR